MNINNVKEYFLEKYPIIKYNINGVNYTHSDDERLKIIDSWVFNYFNEGFEKLRNERNALLKSSDWTQIEDAPVDKNAWAEYRQALRDLPANTTDLENPVWPTPPE